MSLSCELLSSAKIIFWDFDGVIKESISEKGSAFLELFDFADANTKRLISDHHNENGGLSREEKIPLYLKWSVKDYDEEKVPKLIQRFSEIVVDKVLNSRWVQGAEEFIKSNKYAQEFILLSATPQHEIEYILNKLNLTASFTEIYGSPHEKSLIIKRTLKSNFYQLSDYLLIGDSRVDFEAAELNGINFLLRKHELNKKVFDGYDGPYIYNFEKI